MAGDPFGTEGIRRRVLAAWAASPARFREDANAEEDLVSGAYRDRLLTELAQNAADAAARAGVAGILRLSLLDGELRAANTGAPLEPDGVEALATLRASAKRDEQVVGRFGVGFAAVLAVTDEPSLVSTTGGVRFSAADTLAEVDRIPALADELHRRHRHVPVLRLPWPAAGEPPAGFTSEVWLPLGPGLEIPVRAALAELDPTILLALPALRRIEIDLGTAGHRVLSREDSPDGTVRLRDGDRQVRWRARTAAGTLSADLLAGRPVEERARTGWALTWAVPVDADGVPRPLERRQVVHAPTPSDEPVSLPARLVATFPLGSDRRHVAPGPITELLVREAAAAYAALVADLPPTPASLALVPRPGLAAAELDAALCRSVLAALRATSWLPTVGGPDPAADGAAAPDGAGVADGVPAPDGGADGATADNVPAVAGPAALVAPGDAVVVDAASPELVAALAGVVPALLPADWSGRQQATVLSALGVRRLSTADVVEAVSGVQRPPVWWRQLYVGLADVPDRDALTAIPVPLVDGRTVVGAPGLLLVDEQLPAEVATALSLRIVHPEAAHPLLERLGAMPSSPQAVLADDRVRAAVEASYEEEDPEPVANAVLALVAAAGVTAGELPWLAELALPGADGEWYPAGELLLPGSPLAEVIADDAPFGLVDPDLLAQVGPDVLVAVGVLVTFGVLRVPDVEVDPDGEEHSLDGELEWFEAVLDRLPPQPVPPRLAELVAVRDLELVRPDAWEQALPLVAARPGATAPAVAELQGGERVEIPSYTRWWLATHPVLAGRRPDRLRLPTATDLTGLYDLASRPAAGTGRDSGARSEAELLRLVGCLTGVADLLVDPDAAADLLDRLGDPDRSVLPSTLRDIYPRLAVAFDGFDGYEVEPVDRVRVAPDLVVPASAAVVLDLPYLLPLLGGRSPVPAAAGPGPVADLLGLPFASELVGPARPGSVPVRTLAWRDVAGADLAAERCGGGSVPADAVVAIHDQLLVEVGDGRQVPVPWWPAGGIDHIDSDADISGLGRALAWRLDRWDRRSAAIEALADPANAAVLRAEDTVD